jgi:ParB-like chromosome segregation protein Spo0J
VPGTAKALFPPGRTEPQPHTGTLPPLEDLKLDPANPRVHTAQQVRQIARSIKAFGFNVPVLVDTNLKVVAGHGRILAAKKLGCAEIPTIRIDHLSEAQVRAFAIADNRLSEIATWDDKLLAEQLKALSEVELDFDLEVTGFAMGEFDLRIEGLEVTPEGAPIQATSCRRWRDRR